MFNMFAAPETPSDPPLTLNSLDDAIIDLIVSNLDNFERLAFIGVNKRFHLLARAAFKALDAKALIKPTLLFDAVKARHVLGCKAVLAAGGYVHMYPGHVSANNNAPLVIACERGYEDIARVLLKHCKLPETSPPNMLNVHSMAVNAALDSCHYIIIRILYDAGIYRPYTLLAAARSDDPTFLHLLHSHEKDLVNFTAEVNSRGLLIEAARVNAYHNVQTLLDLGADINQRDNRMRTALTFAAEKKHLETWECLLKHDVITQDVLLQDPLGSIHQAVYSGNFGMCQRLLMSYPEDSFLLDSFNRTPLHVSLRVLPKPYQALKAIINAISLHTVRRGLPAERAMLLVWFPDKLGLHQIHYLCANTKAAAANPEEVKAAAELLLAYRNPNMPTVVDIRDWARECGNEVVLAVVNKHDEFSLI